MRLVPPRLCSAKPAILVVGSVDTCHKRTLCKKHGLTVKADVYLWMSKGWIDKEKGNFPLHIVDDRLEVLMLGAPDFLPAD